MPDLTNELLSECDHIFNQEDWETTYNAEDLSDLAESADITWGGAGKVMEVGRLKSLSPVFAVSVAIAWDEDGDPDDWETRLYLTKEEAKAAYESSLSRNGEPNA